MQSGLLWSQQLCHAPFRNAWSCVRRADGVYLGFWVVGFLLPQLLLECFSRALMLRWLKIFFFLIPQPKDTPVPIVNILGEKENSVILNQNTFTPFWWLLLWCSHAAIVFPLSFHLASLSQLAGSSQMTGSLFFSPVSYLLSAHLFAIYSSGRRLTRAVCETLRGV